MDTTAILCVSLLILCFGMFSGRLDRSSLTAPMFFALAGLLASWTGLLKFDGEHPLVHALAEIALVVVLFSDAARIELRKLGSDHNIPLRMLSIGMPLTIILGTLFAWGLIPGATLAQAALIAAILAPTDAALGQAVVSNPVAPVRIRQALNVESGLKDGLALPFVLIFLAMSGATGEHVQASAWDWGRFVTLQLTLGPAVGVFIGYFGGKVAGVMTQKGWVNDAFQRITALGLALSAYAMAEVVGGNGFVGAFCAGLVLGSTSRSVCKCLFEFAEAEGQLLTLIMFFVFGGAFLMEVITDFQPRVFLYALMSLTVIRMIPVALSLTGLSLRLSTVMFLGWFGPRGIASILYALLIVEARVSGLTEMVMPVVVVTVGLSILLHGLTAYPAVIQYSRRIGGSARGKDAPEFETVHEMPLRIPHSGD